MSPQERTLRYTYTVKWNPASGYIATVAEFPSLSWYEPPEVTPLDALRGLFEIVTNILIDMETTGETPPPLPVWKRDTQ